MKRYILLSVFYLLISCFTGNAQNTHQSTLTFNIGQPVSFSPPDTVYKATALVFVGDSISVSSIHFTMLDTTALVFEKQYTLSTLPSADAGDAWIENNTIHLYIPDYDPLKRKHYVVELLNASGQLQLQIAQDF